MRDSLDILYDDVHRPIKYLHPFCKPRWSPSMKITTTREGVRIHGLKFSDANVQGLAKILPREIHTVILDQCDFSTDSMYYVCMVLFRAKRVVLRNIHTTNVGHMFLHTFVSHKDSQIKSLCIDDVHGTHVMKTILMALPTSKIELFTFNCLSLVRSRSGMEMLSRALVKTTSLRGFHCVCQGMLTIEFAKLTETLAKLPVTRVFFSDMILDDDRSDALITMIKTPGSQITSLRFYNCIVNRPLTKLTECIGMPECPVVDFGIHKCACISAVLSTMRVFLSNLKTSGKVMERVDMGFMAIEVANEDLRAFAAEFEGIQVRAMDVSMLFDQCVVATTIVIESTSSDTPSLLKRLFVDNSEAYQFKKAAADPRFKLEYLGDSDPTHNSRYLVRMMANCKRLRQRRPNEVVELVRMPKLWKYNLDNEDDWLDDGVDYEAEGFGDF